MVRKGGEIVTIPLAPRTARAIDLAIGERLDGPIFLRRDGQRIDRNCASRIVHRVARRAGVDKPIGPYTLPHAFIPAALDAGVPLRDVQEAASDADPRTTMGYDQARVSLDRHADRHRRRLPGRRCPIAPRRRAVLQHRPTTAVTPTEASICAPTSLLDASADGSVRRPVRTGQ